MTSAPAPEEGIAEGGAGLARDGRIPRHVAIIMDGNGRWAQQRGLPRVAGHSAGAEAVRRALQAAADNGVEVLTIYAFSSENWRRPVEEVSDLMGLLRHFIRADLNEIAEAGVRIRVIGDYRAFQDDVVKLIDGAIERTVGNTGMTLVIALNYGSHNEIARAAQALAERARGGEIEPAAITADAIAAELDTADIPPVDLLIRTSGERRLSNFLLWQAAYAELLFVDILWPDFDGETFGRALADYAGRERRFGGR